MHLKLIHQWFLPHGGESFCCTEKLQTKDMAATSLEGWGLTLVCCGIQTHPLWLVFRSRTFSGAFNHWVTSAPMRSHWWGKFSGVNCSQAHLLFSWRTLRRIPAPHTPTPREVFNFWAHSALRPNCAHSSKILLILCPCSSLIKGSPCPALCLYSFLKMYLFQQCVEHYPFTHSFSLVLCLNFFMFFNPWPFRHFQSVLNPSLTQSHTLNYGIQ